MVLALLWEDDLVLIQKDSESQHLSPQAVPSAGGKKALRKPRFTLEKQIQGNFYSCFQTSCPFMKAFPGNAGRGRPSSVKGLPRT